MAEIPFWERTIIKDEIFYYLVYIADTESLRWDAFEILYLLLEFKVKLPVAQDGNEIAIIDFPANEDSRLVLTSQSLALYLFKTINHIHMCLQQDSRDQNKLNFIKFIFLTHFSFRSIISRKSESLNNLVFSFPAKLLEIIESEKEDKNT